MKIVHRNGFVASKAQRRKLEALGLKIQSGPPLPGCIQPLVSFDIAESDPNWDGVQILLNKWGIAKGIERTEFTKKEFETASWLSIGAHPIGYPQPKDGEFGFRKATYDLTDFCEKCGLGKKQKSPFQMKGEPRWGRRGIMQLTWVYDQLFVTPQVWSTIFKPFDVACRPVLNRKLQELKTVVQLVVEEETHIDTTNLAYDICPSCQRKKFLPHSRGFFPTLKSKPMRNLVRTVEEFGSGAASNHGVLISQKLYRELVDKKVKGASYGAVASS